MGSRLWNFGPFQPSIVIPAKVALQFSGGLRWYYATPSGAEAQACFTTNYPPG
jgi:hypothetical protein